MDIVFASSNANKLKEVSAIGGFPAGSRLLTLNDINFTQEIEEPFDTLEANSLHKARTVWRACGLPCIAEDTGLEVEALNGAPGVFTARYAGAQKSAADNIAKLLKSLEGHHNRRARFRCVVSWIDAQGSEKQFEGILNGTILENPCGTGGFGYDPVFQPQGYEHSLAEMTLADKNKISHRFISFENFFSYLRTIL